MKTTTMTLMVAGGLVVQALAADPATAPSAQTKLKIHTALPLLQHAQPKSVTDDRIEKLGKISSRPWAAVAGQPGPPLFADQQAYVGQPHFSLFWIGKTPR